MHLQETLQNHRNSLHERPDYAGDMALKYLDNEIHITRMAIDSV